MKKLVGYQLLCSVSMLITLVIIWVLPGTYPHDLAALVNKKQMLINKNSPRMIFVGGSSQLTLHSQLIEKELHYSVINMSLWGGLGTMEHLDEIKPHLRPGDLVVVTMEYGTILDKKYFEYIHTNEEAKKFFFLMSPGRHARQLVRDGEYLTVARFPFELSQMKVKSYLRGIMTLNLPHLFDSGFPNYNIEFNANGDRSTPYHVFRPLMDRDTNFTFAEWKDLAFLNEFHDFATARRARIFFYFSPFPDRYYKINERFIADFHDMLKKSFKGTIINTPEDFKLPEDYFADTIYHLNEKGEKIRSAEIVKLLRIAI